MFPSLGKETSGRMPSLNFAGAQPEVPGLYVAPQNLAYAFHLQNLPADCNC